MRHARPNRELSVAAATSLWREEGGKEQRGIKVKAWKKKELSLGHPEEPDCRLKCTFYLSESISQTLSDTPGDTVRAPHHPFSGVITLQIPKFVAGTIFNASAIGRNDPSGNKQKGTKA